MATRPASDRPGRPGRKPSLNAEHTAVLRTIIQEQPRSSLDEVTRELLRRSGIKVNPVTVRKALRESGIERLKPVRRAGQRAAAQGSTPKRYGYTDAQRRSDGPRGMNTDLTDAEWALVDQLGVTQMHWLGTSMGGAIGLKAAAGTLKGRIQRLVLNDIGPQLAEPAIERIRSYAGKPPAFATMGELEAYFRSVYKPYGWLSDAQWRQLTETSMRRLPDGCVTPHYDPAMVQQFVQHPRDYDQWDAWDSLSLPVLCLRGEHSDLLLPEVADAMRVRGPRALVVTIADCGHAPALNTPQQWSLVERFLVG